MNIRNVAIIAHVDHGKTTLVDALLRQSKTTLKKDVADVSCIMDSNELERERGITIFSKNASVQVGDTKINIIDTPGHADFGGEVERVLTMADGCLLLIDAQEGPMPQTRFVLKKALEQKLRIVVVINKIDKPDARIEAVLNETFDLFIDLGADDKTAEFPVVYASAKEGKAGIESNLEAMTDITPLFDAIIREIPAPKGDPALPLQMLVTSVSADSFRGRIATGRIVNGIIRQGQDITHIARDGASSRGRVVALMSFFGLERIDVPEATAGDIVAIAGIADATVGETIADPERPERLEVLKIEEPTVRMLFLVNDSPFAGKEGVYTTSRQIRERLFKELETDMALRVEDASTEGVAAAWSVSGRGELHLAILIERLRREGFELQVSRPMVISKTVDGKTHVPFERVYIEVPDEYAGAVIQKLGSRRGQLRDMHSFSGIARLEFIIPTRGLFGYRTEFLTDTRGLGIMNTLFEGYQPDPGEWSEKTQGSLVAHETGTSNLYGLLNVQDRGALFIGPGVSVYMGQVVGQHSRGGDLRVNVCKTKQLSNMRSKGDGSAEHFNAPREMDLEDSIEYIGDDELVEATPKSIRIRKIALDEHDARRKQLGLAGKK